MASRGQAGQALGPLSHFPSQDWVSDVLFYKDKGTQEGRDKKKHVGGAVELYNSESEVPRPGLWLTGLLPRALL